MFNFKKNLLSSFLAIFVFVVSPSQKVLAQNITACDADINQDGIVDLSDYSLLVFDFLKFNPSVPRADINSDGVVDISDYAYIVNFFFNYCSAVSPTPTSIPNTTPPVQQAGWSQHGGNAQRAGYTPEEIPTPWRYLWQWNGAGSDGKPMANHLSVPSMVQPITGGGRVYMVAANQVFALNKSNGSVLWSRGSLGSLSGTPAYDNEFIYVGSENGTLYKLQASTGAIVGQSSTGATSVAPLVYGGIVYVASSSGNLIAVNTNTMTSKWQYNAGSSLVSPAALSLSKNLIIVNSQDLYVHAINVNDGSRKWRVKPTTRSYGTGSLNGDTAQFENGWPVIAEQHGIVFVRYRLDWDTLWTGNPYPTTNSGIRQLLVNNPKEQALYALNLDTGTVAFVPAVGNGGAGDGGNLPMGPQPIVKQLSDGKEVVYIIWRNGQVCAPPASWCDGREDATMGEMVLDGNTVAGYQAGDVRFVNYTDIQTDEMLYISMSGNIIFHGHWLINAAEKIVDRSASKGGSYTNPISATHAPYLIWRQVYCPPDNTNCNPQNFPGGAGNSWGPSNCPFNANTRYCSAGLYSYGDQRSYPPGFYEYHNSSQSGSRAFTSVGEGLVLIKTLDGGLIALTSGNPQANAVLQSSSLAVSTSTSSVLGEDISNETPVISYKDALKYVGREVVVEGKIESVVDHRPKAMYLGFKNPHDGELLVRVFEKDLNKFDYDLNDLLGKSVRISGFVTYYWPDIVDPEITVTDSNQIQVIE